MGWNHDAYCDWQPIEPRPTQPCAGGCRTEVDAPDGLCRACRKAAANAAPERIEPQREATRPRPARNTNGGRAA